ncbi:MAG TPA: transcriptional regulator, partial [Deltaproteobacteria bacterium]|nr:transcriptional regulator [Deltaproteobacteria bacterium]
AGRLTRLFDYTFTSDGAYYLVCPLDALERPLVRLFRDWLIAEVASTETFSSTPPN